MKYISGPKTKGNLAKHERDKSITGASPEPSESDVGCELNGLFMSLLCNMIYKRWESNFLVFRKFLPYHGEITIDHVSLLETLARSFVRSVIHS